jgi:protein ImuB
VVPQHETRAALAVLPIAALRLDPVAALQLERLGLRRIGDLYALQRASLAARLGDGVAERLDQALGTAAEPLSPLPPAPVRWARRRFAEPIGTPEALAAATRALLETLCRALGEEMLGARRLTLSCYSVDGAAAPVTIGTARPSRDPHHLFRLFAERLAEIDPGLGIEDMLLAASAVERLAPAQLSIGLSRISAHRPFRLEGEVASAPALPGGGWLQRNCVPAILDSLRATPLLPETFDFGHPPPQEGRGTRRADGEGAAGETNIKRQMARALLSAEGLDRDGTDAAALAALVDRLANRLGLQAVGRLAPQESHVPERAQRFAPVFAAMKKSCPSGSPPRRETRPIRLLPRPEPIEAVAPVPDDPPIFFRWRRLQHRVRRADGPERLCGEWWRGAEEAAMVRDYYRVEDKAGRRFWLYRDGLYRPAAAPRWFLHGIFA